MNHCSKINDTVAVFTQQSMLDFQASMVGAFRAGHGALCKKMISLLRSKGNVMLDSYCNYYFQFEKFKFIF